MSNTGDAAGRRRGAAAAAPRSRGKATDLGRRIREHRSRAGMSREDVAAMARMAGSYLEYLESDPDASPSPATLTRLADALGTSSRALAGAGLELPPGQQGPQPHPLLETLDVAECRTYLADGGVGRFVYVEPRGPVAVPVNYRMLHDDIVFATTQPGTLASAAGQDRVSFEVDRLDEALGEGWSVLVSGRAHLVRGAAEVREAAALGIAPWPAGTTGAYVRVVAKQITGRRLRAA